MTVASAFLDQLSWILNLSESWESGRTVSPAAMAWGKA